MPGPAECSRRGQKGSLGDVVARGTYVVKTATKGMVLIPGGRFRMGSGDFYPEERPIHEAAVSDLWVDEHPVTNAQFRRFVKATGHATVAEQAPDAADFPDAAAADLVPGSLVFVGSKGPIPLDDWTRWWAWVPGTNWRHPYGPGSTLDGRDLHPVVHVGYEDAAAYAVWIGKALPTESQWEYAARGGLDGATYAWGGDFMPKGRLMANTWHGRFPWENLRPHGFDRTSPVKRFAPNGYGLCDSPAMSGSGRPLRHAVRLAPKHRRTGSASYQGRFALVRTLVLPSLPTRGSTRSCRTQHNQSSRISLRASCLVFEAATAHKLQPFTPHP